MVSSITLTSTELAFIKDKEGIYIAHITQKKTGKQVSIPVMEEKAIEVIETGLFRVISDQNYNDYIKELGKIAGIDTITTGTERIELENG